MELNFLQSNSVIQEKIKKLYKNIDQNFLSRILKQELLFLHDQLSLAPQIKSCFRSCGNNQHQKRKTKLVNEKYQKAYRSLSHREKLIFYQSTLLHTQFFIQLCKSFESDKNDQNQEQKSIVDFIRPKAIEKAQSIFPLSQYKGIILNFSAQVDIKNWMVLHLHLEGYKMTCISIKQFNLDLRNYIMRKSINILHRRAYVLSAISNGIKPDTFRFQIINQRESHKIIPHMQKVIQRGQFQRVNNLLKYPFLINQIFEWTSYSATRQEMKKIEEKRKEKNKAAKVQITLEEFDNNFESEKYLFQKKLTLQNKYSKQSNNSYKIMDSNPFQTFSPREQSQNVLQNKLNKNQSMKKKKILSQSQTVYSKDIFHDWFPDYNLRKLDSNTDFILIEEYQGSNLIKIKSTKSLFQLSNKIHFQLFYLKIFQKTTEPNILRSILRIPGSKQSNMKKLMQPLWISEWHNIIKEAHIQMVLTKQNSVSYSLSYNLPSWQTQNFLRHFFLYQENLYIIDKNINKNRQKSFFSKRDGIYIEYQIITIRTIQEKILSQVIIQTKFSKITQENISYMKNFFDITSFKKIKKTEDNKIFNFDWKIQTSSINININQESQSNQKKLKKANEDSKQIDNLYTNTELVLIRKKQDLYFENNSLKNSLSQISEIENIQK